MLSQARAERDTRETVVNPLGLTGSYLFHHGTSGTALSASTAPVAATVKSTTLAAKTTYYFQLVVVTTAGGSGSGSILSFTTN